MVVDFKLTLEFRTISNGLFLNILSKTANADG